MVRSAHVVAFAAQLRLNGECVTYTKTDGTQLQMKAVRGQTPFRETGNQNNGGRIIRSTDWLFAPCDFHRKVGRWPEEGDTIAAKPANPVSGVKLTTFRVTPFNGEPAYRTDPTYSKLRIHTNEIAEV